MKSIFIVIFLLSNYVYAIDSAKCSKMLNEGWFKKYEFGGVGDYNLNAMTKATKTQGTTTATGYVTTEGTTALSDPKYYSNVSTSQTQSTSSWGDCSIFAKTRMQEYQEKYIALNREQILKQTAFGSGEHLDTLAFLNICEDASFADFKQEMKANYSHIANTSDEKEIVLLIKNKLQKNTLLNKKCSSDYIVTKK